TITARKNPPEFRRVLRPEGWLIAVVSAEDDLAELRRAVLGEAFSRDRAGSTADLFQDLFCLEKEYSARTRLYLEKTQLADLLASSYRGARYRAREKLARIEGLDVTLSYRLLCFRPTDKEDPG
ncbi:MAG: hypothetical protein JXB25_00025, partial [Deltaproteobacteria bacterium]|nr:hypothetical protein [Deltaproteobacteria bacterium]